MWDWNIATQELHAATPTGLIRALSSTQKLSLVAATDDNPGWSGDPYNRRTA